MSNHDDDDLSRFMDGLEIVKPPTDKAAHFPPEIERLAGKAMNQSRKDLVLLTLLCEINEPLGEYPQALDVFFHHLSTPTPLRFESESDWIAFELAAIAFSGVRTAVSACTPPEPIDSSYIILTFASLWPKIWKWMKCLHSQATSRLKGNIRTRPKPLIHNLTTQPLADIVRIIWDIFHWPSNAVRREMEATPGIFLLVVDVWIKRSQKLRDDQPLPHECGDAAFTLVQLLGTDTERINLFVGILGGDLEKIASFLLKSMRLAPSMGPDWIAFFAVLLHISWVVKVKVPGLGHALLSQNAMADVGRAFESVSSLSMATSCDAERYNRFEPCLRYCMDHFLQASATTDGSTWIIQGLRFGLITSLLRSANRPSKEVEERIIKSFNTIEKYLVYRSVLRAVDRALQHHTVPLLESKIRQDEALAKHWDYFISFVKTRLEIKAAFDDAGKYAQKCSAPQCNKVEAGEGFGHCSVCQLACYCSKSCQRRDWKEGSHRTECEEPRNDRADGISSQIAPRDEAFFRFLSIYEMKKHQEQIINTRDQTADISSGKPFVIYMDHATIPPKITTLTTTSWHQLHQAAHFKLVRHLKTSKRVEDILKTQQMDPVERGYSPRVIIQLEIPCGEAQLKMPVYSELANSLFGW